MLLESGKLQPAITLPSFHISQPRNPLTLSSLHTLKSWSCFFTKTLFPISRSSLSWVFPSRKHQDLKINPAAPFLNSPKEPLLIHKIAPIWSFLPHGQTYISPFFSIFSWFNLFSFLFFISRIQSLLSLSQIEESKPKPQISSRTSISFLFLLQSYKIFYMSCIRDRSIHSWILKKKIEN